jgi:hypothetical protein
MAEIAEILDSGRPELTFRQRWASYLTIIVAVLGVLAGNAVRGNVVSATFPFSNPEVGVSARYPANWLLQEGGSAFVLRARDPAALPFKTTLQVRLIPTGPGVRPGDILNLLDLDRARRLPAYRSLSREPVTLPDGQRGTRMVYAYAYVESDPFLQAEPITVRAMDIVVLRTNQAVVITYESEAASFERNRHYFESFLGGLVF